MTVTLDVTPRPLRAMSDLLFTVRVSPPEAVAGGEGTVALEMSGMYMGDNRVRLAPAAGGSWQGKGVVVRCPSGRRGWTAQVTLPAPGQPDGRLVAAFELEVVE